jgi:hypothetical protein
MCQAATAKGVAPLAVNFIHPSAWKNGILGSSAILATTATLDADALVGSVGSAALRPYVADKGFEGEETHQRWLQSHGVRIVCPLKGNGRKGRWPKRLGRWAVSIRQINRDRLRKAARHFRPSPRAPSRHGGMRKLIWWRGWRCTASAPGSANDSAILG